MPTRKTTTAPNDKYRQDALAAAQAALDKKGIEPVLLDLTQSGSYTDYLLITSGQADRTVRAIADGIVEVMKLMNSIGSECEGVVVEILVEDGQAVAHGQDLIVIAPRIASR